MTETFTAPVFTLDEEIELGEARPHIECCRVERFFCGIRYHAELSAVRLDASEEEVCQTCMDIMHEYWCWRGHQHCPIPILGGLVCPGS